MFHFTVYMHYYVTSEPPKFKMYFHSMIGQYSYYYYYHHHHQNKIIQNVNTLGEYDIQTIGVQHEFANQSLGYTLPHTINKVSDLIKHNVYTHSLTSFVVYM